MSSKIFNHTLLVHTSFFHQLSRAYATTSLLNWYILTLDTLPISAFNRFPNLEYTLLYPILSPNSLTISVPILFTSYPAFPVTQFFTEHLNPCIRFHLDFSFSTRPSVEILPLPSLLLMPPSSTYLAIPQGRSVHQNQHIKNFIQLYQHHGYKCYIFNFDEGGELAWSADFLQLCFDHKVIVKTTDGYA